VSPILFVAGLAGLLAAAAAVETIDRWKKARKGEQSAHRWDDPSTMAGGYFYFEQAQNEPESSRYQELVSQDQQSQGGWER
jgi:hypothetical protein